MKLKLTVLILGALAGMMYLKVNQVEATQNRTCHYYELKSPHDCHTYTAHSCILSGPCPTTEPSPEPTPTPVPTPTPEPGFHENPTPAPYVAGPTHISEATSIADYHPQTCNGVPTTAPTLVQLGSNAKGCMTWRVLQPDEYEHAVFSYGYTSDNLEFGIPDMGNSHDFTFETCELNPGSVWGQVSTERNKCASYSDIVDPIVR